MCGIAGFLSHDPAERADLHAVRRLCDAIRHRGPDAEGTWVEGPCALGHRRLSIIDLSPDGRQPMVNEDGTVALVVNGEFYDFQPLRDELVAKGHTFRSRSDSEVALHLYEEMGDAFLQRLHGMFALALYDVKRRRLLLARDRAGKKPLYYRILPRGVAFASEVHALITSFPELRPEVDLEAVEEYLTLGYTCAPGTVYKNVYKLRAAHTLVLEPGRVGTPQRYWKAPRHPPLRGSEEDLAQELRWRMMESVKRRMVADVPLGAFLSGGVDSSSVVAMMATLSTRPVKTFSIDFPQGAYSEVKYARMVAKRYGTEHHEMTVTANMTDCVMDIVRHHGEPFADSSAVATYYLAKMTRDHVTVALSGDGGDENFGGYKRYNTIRIAHLYDTLPDRLKPMVREGMGAFGRAFFPSIGRFAATLDVSEAARYLQLVNQFSPDRRAALKGPALRGVQGGRALQRFTEVLDESDGRFPMARILDLDFSTYLTDDINAKVDIASMTFALEVRCPLLDTEVVEFAARLPAHFLMRARGKYLLRRAVAPMLPWEILHRPKMGFGIPLSHWLRYDLRTLLHDTLLGRAARQRGMYDPAYVERMLATLDTRKQETYAIWALFMLELWFQEFIDRVPTRAEVTATPVP
jgi:asparagine synthase (glutamine-hydrolysing)